MQPSASAFVPGSVSRRRSSGVHAPVFVPKAASPAPSSFASLPQRDDLPPAFAPRTFVPSAAPGPSIGNGHSDLPELTNLDLSFDPFAQLQQPGTPQPADNGYQNGFDPQNGGMMAMSDQYYVEPPAPRPHHPKQPLANNAFFMSATLREELQRRNEAMWQGLGPGEGAEVGGFWGLYPLDTPPTAAGKDGGPATANIFGHRSWVYKAGSEVDGKCYVLRRLEDFRIHNEHALSMVERWRRVRHPNIVSVREAFTTRGFGDHSICFVYDYHPLSSTLLDVHLTPRPPVMRNGRIQPHNMQVSERTLWSYIIQLLNAIRTAHQAGLACRTIQAGKILLTGKNRIRINCVSMLDVIHNDEASISALQHEDLFDLGKLIISLACSSVAAVHNLPRSLEHVGRIYSAELQKVVIFLFSKPGPSKSIDDLIQMLAFRILEDLNATQNEADLLESEMMREVENARLVRLLCKFGFINERPEFDHDPRWSETGDRYVIKLFRDYIFHQVDERGRPVVDLSHVLTCLNKLDAGVDERITLVSRDAQSCLVVSYKEVKSAINGCFRDLAR